MRQLEDRALRPRGRQRLHQLHDRLRPGRRARDRRAVVDDNLLRHLIGAVRQADIDVRTLLKRPPDRRECRRGGLAVIVVVIAFRADIDDRQEARLEGIGTIADSEPQLEVLVVVGRHVARPLAEVKPVVWLNGDAYALARLDPCRLGGCRLDGFRLDECRAVPVRRRLDKVLDLPLPDELMPKAIRVRIVAARAVALADQRAREGRGVDGIELPADAGDALRLRNVDRIGRRRAGPRLVASDGHGPIARRQGRAGE